MMSETKFKYLLIVASISILVVTSCQKVIKLKLNNAPPQMVIEANVTDQDGPQYVYISKSVPFTSTNNFPAVSDATIVLNDNSGSQYSYSEINPGVYVLYSYKGVYGKTYTLTVEIGDTLYTAQSTMPAAAVPLDSITDKPNVIGKSSLRTVTVYYQDPPALGNQYLFTLYVNSEQSGTIFTNDDSFTNGRYVSQDLFQTDIDINPSDTATVNMQCIDKNIYQYWYTLSQQQVNGPGGGVTPSNPPSNFNNNALGYFSAHTTQTKSIIVH
jgi:hypothetical protein